MVTVGRFRQFVNAWKSGSGLPGMGSGKHTHLNNGQGLKDIATGGFEPGWATSDNGSVQPTDDNLSCVSGVATWTPAAGTQENLPITCVTWFEAYAFCIWDGGFLPSDAEWEYAEAGGSQQRQYAWGSTDPGTMNQFAIFGCYYPAGSNGTCSMTVPVNVAPVGSAPFGAGAWGQLDLGGEAETWVLDGFASYVTPCTDCGYVQNTARGRVLRGTSSSATGPGSPWERDAMDPNNRTDVTAGVRCARTP